MPTRMTPRAFIQKATAIHGDRYDYSQVSFVHSGEKLPIVCKKHGLFHQSPAKHLAGQGCRRCSVEQMANRCRLSAKDFIAHARLIHGDKFNYDKVRYLNNQTKVIIICPQHGEFRMAPANHTHKTNPQGCPQCGGRTNWNQERFIRKAKELHGERYSYFKVKFVNGDSPVTVICKTHGDFNQKPSKHLLGQGCPICAGTKKLTREEFIRRARAIHADKYGYDTANYVNNQTKVTIRCPIHRDFQMTPGNHTNKSHPQGCPRCGKKKIFSTNDFVARASEIHDSLYDYSRTNYVDSATPVEIVCPYHGPFMQKPSVHLQGSGCSKCRLPKGEHQIELFLREAKCPYECQHSFPDCRHTNPLLFDFVVFVKGKIALIEYSGEQHYHAVSFGVRASDKLEEIQTRDRIKVEYCRKNGIPLLVIKFDEYPQIDEKVRAFLLRVM